MQLAFVKTIPIAGGLPYSLELLVVTKKLAVTPMVLAVTTRTSLPELPGAVREEPAEMLSCKWIDTSGEYAAWLLIQKLKLATVHQDIMRRGTITTRVRDQIRRLECI